MNLNKSCSNIEVTSFSRDFTVFLFVVVYCLTSTKLNLIKFERFLFNVATILEGFFVCEMRSKIHDLELNGQPDVE